MHIKGSRVAKRERCDVYLEWRKKKTAYYFDEMKKLLTFGAKMCTLSYQYCDWIVQTLVQLETFKHQMASYQLATKD